MGLADHSDPRSLSTWLRRRRDRALRLLISTIAAREGQISIVDMGGTTEYWRRVGLDFLRENSAWITLINAASDDLGQPSCHDDIFTYKIGNACDLSEYPDRFFHLSHSNSVIEHVETWNNMKLFAHEARRVAESYYVQTPYYWFPIDPHYYKAPLFHWLPRPTRAWLLRQFPIAYAGRVSSIDSAYAVVDQARLLDQTQFRFLFPEAKVSFERFGGLRKSLIGIRGPEPSS